VDVAFYTVTDSKHFLGVVGLVNSLRLVGHDEPLFVTDAGLTSKQRSLLARAANVIPSPGGVRAELAKTVAPRLHPAAVMVVLDADVLVVKHLGPLIDIARSEKLVLFENNLPGGRFFDEWSALGLGTPDRATYVIAGHYLGARSLMLPMLETVARLERGLDPSQTYFGGGTLANPLYFGDQDIMNAYLMTSVEASSIVTLGKSLSPVPPFRRIRRVRGVRCVGPNGLEPYLLHHILRKPWLAHTRRNVYVDVLRHVLWAPEAQIVLNHGDVPLRLRPSRVGRLELRRVSAQATFAALFRGQLDVRGKVRRVSGRLVRRVAPGAGDRLAPRRPD
jgi:hypothetical protein